MIGGKFKRNFKKPQLPKDNSASSIKDSHRYKYNMFLSNLSINENYTNKNNNISNSIENNDSKEGSIKLNSNKTNKNILDISKSLTYYNSNNKLINQDKENEKDKGKEKENEELSKTINNSNNINNQVSRRINFRERLNNSRKKRAFLMNNNKTNNTCDININNKGNNDIICNMKQDKGKSIVNIIRNENRKKKIYFTKKELTQEIKRKKEIEVINEKKEIETPKNDIEKDSFSTERDIREENLGNEIKDTVKCKICLQKMIHPKMCPKCKNISCEKCLYNWFLKEQNKECNYCKEPINFYEFISVPFMDTIVDFVEKVIYDRKKYSSSFQNNYESNICDVNEENNIKNIKENCDTHQSEKIHYYCLNCNKGYCKTCFVFFGNEKDKHVNHKIIEYSNYKSSNLSLLAKQEEKIEYNINYINDLIKQCNSYKILYENQQKNINDYISVILKEYNDKMDKVIRDIDNKIDELKQYIESYQKAKNEIDDFFQKLTVKSRYSSNLQYILEKNENLCNNKVDLNMILNIPENFNLNIYKSKEEEFNLDIKYLNKKIIIGEQIEITVDNNKLKNHLNINFSIPKDNKNSHFYKVILYCKIKESNIINVYFLDDLKEKKNYYIIGKKIQYSDDSIFEIKSIIYDFFLNN